MTNIITYPYAVASKVAEYIATQLRPHCTRLHIAGSIRRMRPEVSDIEIVCQPKTEVKFSGLFQEEQYITDRNFTEALAGITEAIIKGNVDGRYMQIKTSSKLCPGIYLDLFMPQPADYYRQYAIRTGSADYAHYALATAWRRKGWTGIKDLGLRLISECDCKEYNGKKTYTLKKDLAAYTLPPVWQTEAEFFTWLGLDYIDPERREYHSTVNIAQ